MDRSPQRWWIHACWAGTLMSATAIAGGTARMSYDLVIRGGAVIDGAGTPAVTADVAVEAGRIVEVGRVEGRGRRELDADGAVVTPGFVDIHTHYDGQA